MAKKTITHQELKQCTVKNSTDREEHDCANQKTFKVWVEIEEYDEVSEQGVDCDAPGGSLATFATYEEAYAFAERIDRDYSSRRTKCDLLNGDLKLTPISGCQQGNPGLPPAAFEAIDAVLLYLWESERVDYEQCLHADRQKHIFRHLQTLRLLATQAS